VLTNSLFDSRVHKTYGVSVFGSATISSIKILRVFARVFMCSIELGEKIGCSFWRLEPTNGNSCHSSAQRRPLV
jgi:hypothetical protein